MPYQAPPDLAGLSLAQIAEAVASRKLPPVNQWQPPETIDSQMRIAGDGRWFHDGRPIGRAAMVRAFSSLLVQEADGQHYLYTPGCKQTIAVEDAAFIAVDMRAEGGALAFRLNTDELVLAGPDNPLRAAGDADCPAIYLAVRNGCEARLDRSTWLQLAEYALATCSDPAALSVSSQGAAFALTPA